MPIRWQFEYFLPWKQIVFNFFTKVVVPNSIMVWRNDYLSLLGPTYGEETYQSDNIL